MFYSSTTVEVTGGKYRICTFCAVAIVVVDSAAGWLLDIFVPTNTAPAKNSLVPLRQ